MTKKKNEKKIEQNGIPVGTFGGQVLLSVLTDSDGNPVPANSGDQGGGQN